LYHAFAPGPAAAVTAVAAGTIYAVQLLLAPFVVPAAASAASDLAVIVLLIVIGRGRLGLRPTPLRFLVAGALIGISAWYVDLLIVVQISEPRDTESLQQLVEQPPLTSALLALAMLPAIAEELMFRGVLARGLATRWSPMPAIAVSALAFSAYHMAPIQMLATFPLGLFLGFLALRAGSVIPSMIVHALNNTVAITLSRDELPAASAWIGGHPVIAATGAIVLVAGGVTLAASGNT
jgi:membrane protease YdiL (CAAX protease family)